MLIGFEISADYGHFSHPATVYSSLSYPIPPKTTVMGMLGAIMGLDDYLFLNDIRYAVIVKNLSGKRTFCFNGIKDALSQLNIEKAGEGFSKGRKQFYRELLIAPVYEIYCDLSKIGGDFPQRLGECLSQGKSMYPLYMGINMCLAQIRYLGSFTSREESAESVLVDSAIPLSQRFELEAGKQYTDIRMATTVDGGRNFGGFTDYLVETGGQGILCRDCTYRQVNGRNLLWS